MQPGGQPEDPEATSNEAASTEPWDGVERRRNDRRAGPTQALRGLLSPRRRAGGRREEDQALYVDRYTRGDVALLLSIFVLNLGDAAFTMRWLARGGREANPVMDFFLDIGPHAFLAQKCLVVGFWLIVLLVHKNFRVARIGLYASLAVYAVLMVVHFGIVLLGVEPPPPEQEAAQGPPPISTEITRRVDPRASG